MSTYEKWMKLFNQGGGPSFAEFICEELDAAIEGRPAVHLHVDDLKMKEIIKAAEAAVDEAPVTPNNAGDAPVPVRSGVADYRSIDVPAGEEIDPRVKIDAGGSQNT